MADLSIRIAERRNAADPDDHMGLARVLANMTRTTGIDVMTCRSRHEARARIASNTGRANVEAIQVAREVNDAHTEPDSFEARLAAFFAGAQFIHLANYERFTRITETDPADRVYPHDIRDSLVMTIPTARNARYVRINRVRQGGDKSVWGFVDMKGGLIDKKGAQQRGSVLKAAGYKKPAPHARGDIMADDFGLTSVQWTGPAYLT